MYIKITRTLNGLPKKAKTADADTYSILVSLSRFNEPQCLSIYQVSSIFNSKVSFWHIMTRLFRDSMY